MNRGRAGSRGVDTQKTSPPSPLRRRIQTIAWHLRFSSGPGKGRGFLQSAECRQTGPPGGGGGLWQRRRGRAVRNSHRQTAVFPEAAPLIGGGGGGGGSDDCRLVSGEVLAVGAADNMYIKLFSCSHRADATNSGDSGASGGDTDDLSGTAVVMAAVAVAAVATARHRG